MPPPGKGTPDYVLGADPEELARLRHQHEVWAEVAREAFDRAGVGPGWRVLDAGCGPGLVLAELRDRVGAEGEAWGVDREPAMLAEARRELERRAIGDVRLVAGDLAAVELPGAHFDLIWLRWVLSFPPDPGAIVARLSACLRPGGILLVQDYNHEGVSLFPESPGFQAAVTAVRAFYRLGGGDPWVGARLPALMARAGLTLEDYRCTVLAGGPGEPAFEWADRFFPAFTARFVAAGCMTAAHRERFLAEWEERRRDPCARFFSPIVVTAMARRPAAPPR